MKLNSQNLLAVSVLLVSITSVGIAFFQANIMKEQQRIMHLDFEASQWPYIEMSYNYSVGTHFEILVTNKGVGPAIIEGFSIERKGEFYKGWQEVQEEIAIDSISRYAFSNNGIYETVLSAGEERKLFAVYDEQVSKQLFDWYNASEFTICYKSVYDSRWEYKRLFKGNRTYSQNRESSECLIGQKEAFNDVMEF